MISHNWDLFILDPIFLLLGFIALGWMMYKERTSIKWIIFIIETLCFWIVNGISIKLNANQIGLEEFTNPVMIALLFFGASGLFAIILKPLATFLTGKIHHRRYWMYAAIFATFVMLILTIFNKNGTSIALFVFTGFFLAFAIASNSLYFLFLNEQFYYRVSPVLSTTIISVVTILGTYFGSYIVSIENATATYSSSNNLYWASFVVGIILVFTSLGLSFLNKENTETVRGFEFTMLSELPRYNKKRLVFLVISTMAIAAFYHVTQNTLVMDYLRTKLLKENSYDLQQIEPWLRTYATFFIVPQFILGYWIFRHIILKVGYKSLLISVLGISVICIVIMIFVNEPILFIIFNLVLGLAFSQIFYSFFAMAIMWNYRSNGVPVTGFVASASAFGQFMVSIIVSSLKINGVGIYSKYNEINLSDPKSTIEAVNSFNDNAHDIIVIMYAVVAVLLIFSAVWIFFTAKVMFADYLNIPDAIAWSKKLIKTDLKIKISTRVNDEQLGLTEGEIKNVKRNIWKRN